MILEKELYLIFEDVKKRLSFNILLKKYDLLDNELLSLLFQIYQSFALTNETEFCTYLLNEIRANKFVESFNNQTIMVTADLHSNIENAENMYRAYEKARLRKIKKVLLVGDACSGLYKEEKDIKKGEKELYSMIENYPRFHEMNTYFLKGNHDNVLEKAGVMYDQILLRERQDFKILGIENAYISFSKKTIRLNHPVCNNKYRIPLFDTHLQINGHYHRFHIDSKRNIVDCMAISNLQFSNKEFPGFFFLHLEQDDWVIEPFQILQNQVMDLPKTRLKCLSKESSYNEKDVFRA